MSLVPNFNIEIVRKNGGMTFDRYRNPISPQTLNSGYLVGIHSIIASWYSLDDIWKELAYHFWPDEFSDCYLGFWQNPDDLYWYVDFVKHTYDKTYAFDLAIQNHEIAIFDCAEQVSIPTPTFISID